MRNAVLIAAAMTLLSVPAMASHVGHLSLTDHPDVPNCTVSGPNAAGCETVPWFVSASVGYNAPCNPHTVIHPDTHLPAISC